MPSDGAVPEGRAALVLGATGLVGRECLDILLGDERYRLVRTIGRRKVDRTHLRLEQHVAELDRLEPYRDLFAVDEVYCCLGTTIRLAGSQDAFRKIDVDAPALA